MDYEFSWTAFTFGLFILLSGVALVRFYQPLADNLASGVMSYDRFKLAGLIACLVGLIIMLNLHIVLLSWIIVPLFVR